MNNKTILNKFSHWNDVNWNDVERDVKTLQTKIVEAYKTGDKKQLEAAQYTLTNSYSAHLIAVKSVCNSDDSKMPGIDGVIWRDNETRIEAVGMLSGIHSESYKTKSVRRIEIPKSNNSKETRLIGIPTIFDRGVQNLYLLALTPIAEVTADKNSYGYRAGMSTQDAIDAVAVHLRHRIVSLKCIEGDIQKFFDTLDHSWIINNIPLSKPILEQFCKAGYVTNGKKYPTNIGVPQGGIISPVIANMALDGIEKLVYSTVNSSTTNKFVTHDFKVVRYADDFVIIGPDKNQHHHIWNKIIKALEQFLAKRGVTIHPTKTKITKIDNTAGIIFLGFQIRIVRLSREWKKGNTKIITSPSSMNVQSVIEKVRGTAKNLQITPAQFVSTVNPILQGWANYYSLVISSSAFSKIDQVVWHIYLEFLKKKFPKTPKKVLVSIYSERVKSSFRFGCKIPNQRKFIQIYRISDIRLNTEAITERRNKKKMSNKPILIVKNTLNSPLIYH